MSNGLGIKIAIQVKISSTASCLVHHSPFDEQVPKQTGKDIACGVHPRPHVRGVGLGASSHGVGVSGGGHVPPGVVVVVMGGWGAVMPRIVRGHMVSVIFREHGISIQFGRSSELFPPVFFSWVSSIQIENLQSTDIYPSVCFEQLFSGIDRGQPHNWVVKLFLPFLPLIFQKRSTFE